MSQLPVRCTRSETHLICFVHYKFTSQDEAAVEFAKHANEYVSTPPTVQLEAAHFSLIRLHWIAYDVYAYMMDPELSGKRSLG